MWTMDIGILKTPLYITFTDLSLHNNKTHVWTLQPWKEARNEHKIGNQIRTNMKLKLEQI